MQTQYQTILVPIGLASFLLGSVPFGVLVARSSKVDLSKVGSGNTGATNAFRVLGPVKGSLVLILDILKGLIPALVGRIAFGSTEIACILGVSAVLGHAYSPFLRFKGGKGVATSLGFLIGALPDASLSILGVFVIVFTMSQIVSLSSIAAAASLPVFTYFYGYPEPVWGGMAVMAALIIVLHRKNIQRLLKGQEPRFRIGSKSPKSVGSSAVPPEEHTQDAE